MLDFVRLCTDTSYASCVLTLCFLTYTIIRFVIDLTEELLIVIP